MILVGQFNEKQLRNGEDKACVEKMKKETALKYTRTCIIKKKGIPVALKIWLLTSEEYFNSSEI